MLFPILTQFFKKVENQWLQHLQQDMNTEIIPMADKAEIMERCRTAMGASACEMMWMWMKDQFSNGKKRDVIKDMALKTKGKSSHGIKSTH